MSHYDYRTNTVHRWRPWRDELRPVWLHVDCGCSGGIQWGGDTPRDCLYCVAGWYVVHEPSGTCAAWPGGPLIGRHLSPDEVAAIVAELDGP